jgi:hypothetical protein
MVFASAAVSASDRGETVSDSSGGVLAVSSVSPVAMDLSIS